VEAGTEGKMGRQVILPSSYPGSPRSMHQHYLDAMAILRKYGKPDLFITFTANPQWKEIQDNLRSYEYASDRPDPVARVFNLKKKAFLSDLIEEAVLGDVIAYTWVVEFQKRGLPHLHVLLVLSKSSKIFTATAVDQYVCAEIPSLTSAKDQSQLREIVQRCQVHGPCGVRNPTAPCMKDGICIKNYPKAFQEEAQLLENAYPRYRRRDNGEVIEKNDIPLDNRDVVPYNPALTKKYDAHINVEVVSSIKAVKYLYKYTFKGHDRADMELEVDEITEHLNSRYFGPAEACWRLFSFPLTAKSHIIVRLVPRKFHTTLTVQ